MESHGGNVELLSLEDGVARIHLRGSCSDCSASSVTLELAIKQALEEAAPDLEGLEVEGVAPQTIGRPGAADGRPAPTPTGMELPVVDVRRRRRRRRGSTSSRWRRSARRVARGGRASPAPSWWSRTSTGTLLAYRDACAGCGAPLHDGALLGGRARVPAAARGRSSCPRAGRSMDDERHPARARAAAARAGPREGGARAVSATATGGRPASLIDDAVAAAQARASSCPGCAGSRGAGAQARRRRHAGAAAPATRRALRPVRRRDPRATTATCCTSSSGGSCARARRAGRCAPARATTARPATGRCGCPSSTSPTICGRASRSRSGWRSSWTRRSPRASSRCTRARRARPRASCTSSRGAGCASSTRCSRGLEPDIEGLIVNRLVGSAGVRDRADRPLLRADRRDQGAAGRGSRAARGVEAAVTRVLRRRCAREAVAGVSVETGPSRSHGRAPRRPRPSLEFEVLGARPVRYAAAPMLTLDLQVTEPSGRQVYMIALTIQLMIEPARRALRRRHPRAAGRAVRRARALGGDDAQPRLVQARRARARVHRDDDGRRSRSRATTTSSSPRPSTCTRCPTARRRWRCTSTG